MGWVWARGEGKENESAEREKKKKKKIDCDVIRLGRERQSAEMILIGNKKF